jgi:hopene-associated glycosyltransferase HpnB
MIVTALIIAVTVWLWLIFVHGRFWRSGPVLPAASGASSTPVAVVVPARDEAAVIGASVASLLGQTHAALRVIVVDDESSDGTGDIARGLADPRLRVLTGQPKPAGWSGKLWAVAQGVREAGDAAFILLTDADIVHAPGHVAALLAKAEGAGLDLVSEMVALNCESWAERALVPAFVFFFQLLYPFAWVNDPTRTTAAAAGGTILVRATALQRIGGISALRGALIDDVALAGLVKRFGSIWLGHSTMARSLRPYPGAGDIWRMVARTAFVQLRRSWLLLGATVLGMAVVWLLPPAVALFGNGVARMLGLAAWAMAAAAYVPTLQRFGLSLVWAVFLPLIASFYMAATIGSAIDDLRGRGVVWKARAYRGHAA